MQNTSMSAMDEAILAIQTLIKKSKPGTSTTMKSAVAALYTADAQGQLRYSNCIGLLQLDTDRQLKTCMLRFYNMQTISLAFEVQLYYGFINNYKMITATFYVFQYPAGIIGFLFKSKEDADIMKVKISSNSPKMEQFQQIKKQRLEEAKKKKEQGSFLNKLKGFLGDNTQQPQQKSGQVLSWHKDLSFDLKTGNIATNMKDIPPQWQQLFDSLKLTQEDLNNKEVMNIIVQQTVMQQVKTQAEKNQDKNLQLKFKQAEQEEKQYIEALNKSRMTNLPPPPLPPPLLLAPPQLAENRGSFGSKRANLMDEIRNNKLKLNHVTQTKQTMNLDISNMNKQERMDHAARLRQKLKMRKKALNRREASDDQD